MTDGDLVPSSRHADALARAELMAQALRAKAKEVILEPALRETLSRGVAGRAPDQIDERPPLFGRFVRLSFVLIFFLPALLTAIYYAFVASDQYVSEARFAVRSGERSALNAIAATSTLGQMSQAQDTLVVSDYVKSRGLVEEIDKKLNLRAMFSREDIDFISSLPPDAAIEDLVDYWNAHVSASIEMNSGIVMLTVRAFKPEDAKAISDEILARSEALVNRMSDRANHDEVQQAEAEFKRAEDNLKATRVALRNLRNEQGVLDPTLSADALNVLLVGLQKERLQVENALMVARGSMSESAPQVRQMKARLAAIDEQINKLKADLTAATPADGGALSETYGAFEDLELKRTVAENQYASASLAVEGARLAADRQRIYLNTIVQPELAEDALYPSRFFITGVVFVALFLVWGGSVAAVGFVRKSLL